MSRYFQYQVFIGPRLLPSTDLTNFPYYTHMPALGATLAIDYQTAVITSLASGATSLVTTNTSGIYGNFPTTGGLWVGPNGGGQGWEHIGYLGRTTNTFTGLVRESATYRPHNGVHSVGAEVRFWYPVVSDDGVFEFIDQLTPDFSARYWRLDLNGFVLPPSLLRNDHMVVLAYRTAASGDFKFFCLGLSNSIQIRDDFQRQGKWVLHVSSLQGLCENTMIHGVHLGDFNVAQFGEASGSAPLGSAFKELLSGDYSAADPDFSPKSAIDGDMDTLFISDYMVGTAISPSRDGPTQLYLNPHLGRGPAYKWIELTNFSTDGATLKVYDPDTASDYVLDFGDYSGSEDPYRCILTDDPVTFAAENPGWPPDMVQAVPEAGLGPTFLKHCKAHGGALSVWGGIGGATKLIIWGDVSVSEVEDYWSCSWTGPAIAAPGYGQTIAYLHDYSPPGGDDSRNHWAVRDYGTPGYLPRPDKPENAWLAVILPGLGLVLRDNITSSDTSLFLIDGSGEPSTEGLPASGTLEIGAEQITYTGKEIDRVTGATVVNAHSAGDLIYVVENGIATDGFPITDVTLRRRSGGIYVNDFYFRWSRVIGRLPTMGDHEEDYVSPYGGNYHATGGVTADYNIVVNGSSARCRTLLIEFRKMGTDPACARLNELVALADPTCFRADCYADSPAGAGDVIVRMLTLAGVPVGALLDTTTVTIARATRTAREWAWTAITDFADMSGVFVNIQRDSEVTISDNAFYTTAVGGYTADYTWDEDDVVNVDLVTRSGDGIGQVRLAWQASDGVLDGVEAYPASVGARGGFDDIGPYVVVDAAAAQLSARKRFWLKRSPHYVVVELVDVNLAIEPGQFFNLSWLYPGETSPHARLYIVAGVDLRIENEMAVQVVTGLQIDREVEW